MPEFAFTLTKDLVTAFEEICGKPPLEADPIVVMAAYCDALAKEYGLSESLDLDVDPIERTDQASPVMDIVRHYLKADSEAGITVDNVRRRLYQAAVEIADDPRARKMLNRNQPMPERKVLLLAQTYWNLEATADRERLPIKPHQGRDIPVPHVARADFATMTWTTRVNQKCSGKATSQGYRKQGARLAVLIAQRLTAREVAPSPAPSQTLDVKPTADPEQPMQITLKDLIHRAWRQGEYEDAADMASTHLRMTERRAENNPLELEADLAEAYFLRGFSSIRPAETPGLGFVVSDGGTSSYLGKSVASLTMLSELEPSNNELSGDLADALIALSVSQESEGLAEEAVRTAKRAVDIATGLLESRPDDSGTASSLLAALVAVASTARRAGFEDDACAAMQEAVALAERRASAAVGDSERETLVALLWGLAGDLTATERHEEAVRTAERAVALSRALDLSVHDGQARLASALFGLSEALKKAQRFGEAVERAEEAVEIRSTLLKTAEDGIDARRHLAVTLLGLGDALSLDGRIVDVPATVRRAALISLKLAQETAGSEMYLALARASLERLCRSLRDAGRVDEAIEFEDQLRDLDSPPE